MIYFTSQSLQSQTLNLKFELVSATDYSKVSQNQLTQSSANLLRLFNRHRNLLFIGLTNHELNEFSIKILTHLFQPYNNQLWLVKVLESFAVNLQTTATQELTNEQLADQ